MGLKRINGTKLNIAVALVMAVALFCTPSVMVDAAKNKAKTKKDITKSTYKEVGAKDVASVYDVKTNSVNIKLDGYKNKDDIVLKFYEKQDDGKYKEIKTTKKKSNKGDYFKFKQVLNEKSDFDYGKEYKYKLTCKEHYVEKKSLQEYFDYGNSLKVGSKQIFSKTNKKVLSDGDKINLKNTGNLLSYKYKNSKTTKTFKTISKRKRLLEFSKKYKKVVYSQAKRHQEGFADCSSFVYACYKNIGMNMGGEGANTETELGWCEKNALKVKIGSAKLGDIIFYSDEDIDTFEDHYKHVTHVAMFKDNKTIMEMSGEGVNFRTRAVSARDHDCIAVYRPIYDSKDYKDKDNSKQNLKKSKKEREAKLLKKARKDRKKEKEREKQAKKKEKKSSVKETTKPQESVVIIEDETTEKSGW